MKNLAVLSLLAVANAKFSCSAVGGGICGSAGTLGDVAGTSFDNYIAASFNECRDVAAEPGGQGLVGSFGWNKNTGRCRLLYGPLEDQAFTANANSDESFADLSCYRCTPVCPPAVENQVTNGGFENAPRLAGPWQLYANQVHNIVNTSRTGARALGGVLPIGLRQYFSSGCTNRFYRINFWYRFPQGTTNRSSIYYYGGDVSIQAPSLFATTNTSWQLFQDYMYQAEWRTGRYSVEPNLSEGIDGSGARYILDDVSITPLAGPGSALAGSPETITNGGFESGAVSPWVVQPWYSDFASTPYSAGRLVQGQGSRYAFKSPKGAIFAQNVTLVPGKEYLFSFDYELDRTTASSNYVFIRFEMRGPGARFVAGSSTYGTVEVFRGGKQRYARPVVARYAQTQLFITFGHSAFVNQLAYVPIKLDNFSLKELSL